MDEPFHQEVQDAVDAAGAAASISDRQAVALAASFYKNARTGQTFGQYGAGWEVLAQVSAPGGYDGLAMRHAASRTLVIVNRGTEGITNVPDWVQNIRATLFQSPGPQMDSAMALLGDGFDKAQAGGVDQILICGHSLGGALPAPADGMAARHRRAEAAHADGLPSVLRGVGGAAHLVQRQRQHLHGAGRRDAVLAPRPATARRLVTPPAMDMI